MKRQYHMHIRCLLLGGFLFALILVGLLATAPWDASAQADCPVPDREPLILNDTQYAAGPRNSRCYQFIVPRLTARVEISFEVPFDGDSYDLYWGETGSGMTLIASDLVKHPNPYVINVREYRLRSSDQPYLLAVVPRSPAASGSFSIGAYAKDGRGAINYPAAGASSGTGGLGTTPAGGDESRITVRAGSTVTRYFRARCGIVTVEAEWIPGGVSLQNLQMTLVDPSGKAVHTVPVGRAEGRYFAITYPISPDQVRNNTRWAVRYVNRGSSGVDVIHSVDVAAGTCPSAVAGPTPTPTSPPSGGSAGPARTGVVRADFALVRSGPGPSYSTVRRVGNGVVVKIYEERVINDAQYPVWYRIDSPTGPWIWSGAVSLTSSGSAASQTTLHFQNGRYPTNSYQSAGEAVLSQANPIANDKSQGCLADGDDPSNTGHDKTTLLYWDVTAIPAGARVVDATITLAVTNRTSNDYFLYGMNRPWNSDHATWLAAGNGQGWQNEGAQGSSDRDFTVLGELPGAEVGPGIIRLNSTGRLLVQSWIDGARPNYGFAFANTHAADGVDFACSDALPPQSRPMLTVVYE